MATAAELEAIIKKKGDEWTRARSQPYRGGGGYASGYVDSGMNALNAMGAEIRSLQEQYKVQKEREDKAAQNAAFERRMDQITQMADPFASQRGQYQQQLSDLLNDPQGALAKNPFFKASAEQGQEAGMRQLRRMGMGNSGNAALELQKSAQANLASQYMPMAQMLGSLGGAQFSPAAASGAMSQMLGLRESQRQFDTQQTAKPAQWSWQSPSTPSQRGFSAYWGG